MVSAPTGAQTDLDLAVSGGDVFMARMKALKDAKADHDKSLADLRLGVDVTRAMQDVQGREQEAIKALEDAKAECERLIAEARAEAAATRASANEDAARMAAEAKSNSDAVARQVMDVRADLNTWSDRVKEDIAQEREKLAASWDAVNKAAYDANAERIASLKRVESAEAVHKVSMDRLAILKEYEDAEAIIRRIRDNKLAGLPASTP